MKKPEDKATMELQLAEVKRGRGRPAKLDALTPAERAKRYRDAKRALRELMPNNRDATVTKLNSVREAELQFDYTRPTWTEYEQQTAIIGENLELIASLKTQLALTETERNNAMNANIDLTRELEERDYRHHHQLLTQDRGTEVEDARQEIERLTARAIQLTMQYDVEHVQRMEAERALANQIESYKQQDQARVNPLTKKVTALRIEISDEKAITKKLRDAYDKCDESRKIAEGSKIAYAEQNKALLMELERLNKNAKKRSDASRKKADAEKTPA